MTRRGALVCCLAVAAFPQSRTMQEGAHRMEIVLERMDGGSWQTIDPGLVLAQGDRVRFHFRTNFDGYLYVMNQSTSGTYEQLFPREETGQDNRVAASKDYQVPATSTAFRIAGPAGHEIVYWLITPARLNDGAPRYQPVPPANQKSPTLIPRCDDTILKARGDCIDHSAGPKLIPRGEDLPKNLSSAANQSHNDLLFLQEKHLSVVASQAPLTGPVIYEFRLAHR